MVNVLAARNLQGSSSGSSHDVIVSRTGGRNTDMERVCRRKQQCEFGRHLRNSTCGNSLHLRPV